MSAPPRRDGRLPWVSLGYTVLAVVFTWPLVLGLGRDVPGDLGDSLLNMWILGWGVEQLPRVVTGATTWASFWNGNIFHPDPYSLALSEHLTAQVIQIWPVYALTGNIILCYNLLFLSTFVISSIGAYLLVRDLTGDWRAAVIAGLVFGCLPYRISQVPHLQVMSSQWMPFALWGIHRFIVHRSLGALAGGTIALVLQNWSCGYYVLYFAPFAALYAVAELWRAGRFTDWRAWGWLGAAAACTAALTFPFLWPYLHAQRLYGFERSLGEVIAFSANVWSYATAAESIHLWGRALRFYPHGEGETFLGVTATVLMLIAITRTILDAGTVARATPASSLGRRTTIRIVAVVFVLQGLAWLSTVLIGGFNVRLGPVSIRATTPVRLLLQTIAALGLLLWISPRWRVGVRRVLASPVTIVVALFVLAAWLSLGPDPSTGSSRISGFGLYSLLYDYVPGFTGVRVPARYAMVAGVFLAIAAGFGARGLQRRWGSIALPVAALLVVADGAAMPLAMNHTWAGTEAAPPARIYPAADAPPVYRDVKALPDGSVIAEFPFGDPAWEIRAVYYAAIHGKPIVNGYSGAFPPGYRRRMAALQRFKEDGELAWQALLAAKTTHVIVRVRAFATPSEGLAVLAWLDAHGARQVSAYEEGAVLFAVPR